MRISDHCMPACTRLFLVAAFAVQTCAAEWRATDWVNPFIGTARPEVLPGKQNWYIGNTFPGAAYPMGMVQWSPDTPAEEGVMGGYFYPDTVITGFPLTHFSGRGVKYLQNLPVMPTTRAVRHSPGSRWTDFHASFSHQNEAARPGYYSVRLDDGIRVELTATARTGLARFSFPAGAQRTVLLKSDTFLEFKDGVVTGRHQTTIGGGARDFTLYFAALFDRDVVACGTWSGDVLTPGGNRAEGPSSGAYFEFDPAREGAVQMKVALSFVSVEGALANLQAENSGWDFEAVAARADEAWNARLAQIRIEGGTTDERTCFYTALYHCYFHPNVLNDADGRYPGMDGKIHRVEAGRTQYQNIPGWDQYRSFAALRAILTPREMGDIVQSLLNYAEQDRSVRPDGGGLARWQQANRNSGGMVGDGPAIIIANAHAFGVRNFDRTKALAIMDRGASIPGVTSDGVLVREGLEDYLKLGHVPRKGAVTLEYCTADFALSEYAAALGDRRLQIQYRNRAQNWRTLYNPANGYLHPRQPDGTFIADMPVASARYFTEGSAAQYLWTVHFNMRGLFDQLGGNEQVIPRLDHFFTQINGPHSTEHAYVGNEHNLAVPWAYVFAGQPWKTQALVRRIQTELFYNRPGGLPGNDDAGALSSSYIFSTLGLFPAVPGVAGFALNTPLFSSAEIALEGGGVLRIKTTGPEKALYVQTASLNGNPWTSAWLPWSELAAGGTLEFQVGPEPSQWGSDPADAPPSFDTIKVEP